MAIKISALPEETVVTDNDVVAIVDVETTTTKKSKVSTFFNWLLGRANTWTNTNQFNKQVKIKSDGTNSPLVVRDNTDTNTNFEIVQSNIPIVKLSAKSGEYYSQLIMATNNNAKSVLLQSYNGSLYIQTNNGNVSTLFASITGQVAIGTTNPNASAKLQVQGQTRIVSDGTNSPLVVRDNTDTYNMFDYSTSGALRTYKAGSSVYNENWYYTNSDTKLVKFQVYDGGVLIYVGTGTTLSTYFKNNGQVAIGTNNPNASAKLQVDSTTQGFLPPRMTTTERNAIATPAEGLMVYDTTVKGWFGYDGTNWIQL